MPREKPPVNDLGAPGLAGGPGPTPPGVDDGTPHATRAAAPEDVQPAEEQGDEARTAERTAGTRGDRIPGHGGRPPTGEPSEDPRARQAPGARGRGASRRRARRGTGEPER